MAGIVAAWVARVDPSLRSLPRHIFVGTITGALQFSLFMWALRWLPPTTTVLYLTLNPITAMVLGMAVLGESLTTSLIAGMALVLASISIGSGIRTTLRDGRSAR